jgi:photosystem II stability/assembly factor-like uncharacterized protein
MKIFYLFAVFILLMQNNAISQWTECATVVSDPLYCVTADKQGFVLAGGGDGTLIRSYNEGNSFEILKTVTLSSFEQFIRINDTLILAKISGWIHHSTNKGDSWEKVSNRGALRELQMYKNKLYAMSIWGGGGPEEILLSENLGKTWNIIHTIPTTYDVSSLLVIDDSTWYVVGGNGFIMYTKNAGKDWEKQARGMTTHPLRRLLYANDTVVAVGGAWADGFIFYTTRDRDEWKTGFYRSFPSYVDITYSGKVWIGCVVGGNDYSRTLDKWEAKGGNVTRQLGGFTWLDKEGHGYAIGGNKVFRTYNHGISFETTSVNENDGDDILDAFKYYDLFGREVESIKQGLLFKVNTKTNSCLIEYHH